MSRLMPLAANPTIQQVPLYLLPMMRKNNDGNSQTTNSTVASQLQQ
jgi:hypothetical protein